MSAARPLSDVERDLLEAVAADFSDDGMRSVLADHWMELGDAPHERAARLISWYPDLAFAHGFAAYPLCVDAGDPLDGHPDLARVSPLYYRVHGQISGSDFSGVFAAEAVTPRAARRVALKRRGPEIRPSLEQLYALLAAIDRPGWPRARGLAFHPGGRVLALDWHGVDLRRVLEAALGRGEGLGASFAISVVIPVLATLADLEARGVGDPSLTPGDVLVSQAGAVTLTDPLVASWSPDHDRDPEYDGDLAGNAYRLRYLARSRVMGDGGPRGSVWGAALIASELVAGERPYAHVPEDDGLYPLVAAVLQTLPALSPRLPAAVAAALRPALVPEDHARPPAAALHAAVVAAAARDRLDIGPHVIAGRLAALGLADTFAASLRP